MISADQVSSPFLCSKCEDRFSKNGERYVLSQCARRNGEFKLRQTLVTAQPVETHQLFTLYPVTSVPRLEQYVYFAASIFWRAAAKNWDSGDHPVRIDLGREYLEAFRKFLTGEVPFPAAARLFMHVWNDNEIRFMTVFPCSERREGVWRHKFAIPGILFILFLGKEAPRRMDFGAVNSPESPRVWFRSWESDSLFRLSGEVMTKAPVKSPDLLKLLS
jgi:hypothetical protein